ncbi:MAG TPA: aminotransferase class V-fold PLP-dependent enzyme [Puia sp.]|nr:aminotransferase class V-fold PLP-dependent enzyme [Puia sp.]
METSFDIPGDIVYLNCASLSPQPRSVTEAGLKAVLRKSSPWQIKSGDWFDDAEDLRALVARVMNTGAEGIALVPSVSYGVSVAAANLPAAKGQQILVLDQEYPSNYYSWRELAKSSGASLTIVKKGEGDWTEAIVGAIGASTAIVSVPNCHWTNGALIDLERVSEKTHSVGAALVIDASQSLGAYPMDIEKLDPDFLVSVGYKWLLGPYGLGYLYAAPRWRKEGRPIEYSWLAKKESENFAQLVNYRDEFREGARRFDMGEYPGFINLPMAKAAVSQVLEWGVVKIQSALSEITRKIEEKAAMLGMGYPAYPGRVGHMIGVDFPGAFPEEIKDELNAKNIFVGMRGKSIRVSPYLYTRDSDIEKLFGVIRNYIK